MLEIYYIIEKLLDQMKRSPVNIKFLINIVSLFDKFCDLKIHNIKP